MIYDSWAEYNRTGCTHCHLHRCLYPASPWPRRINWLRVAWFVFVGVIGALIGTWMAAQ